MKFDVMGKMGSTEMEEFKATEAANIAMVVAFVILTSQDKGGLFYEWVRDGGWVVE